MMYFPFFFDLSDKEILIAGAGRIAERRIRALAGFAGRLRIVAVQVSPGIRQMVQEALDQDDPCPTMFEIAERKFRESDLAGANLVLAATDDEKLNARICALCRKRKIPVNVCTDAALCDFQFPSVIEDGMTVIGINASGQDHALVKETRKKIEKKLGSKDLKSKYK